MGKNNADVELLAGLDKVASEQQIKKDVKKLRNIFVYLKAKLDLSQIKKQLSKARLEIPIVANSKGVQTSTKQTIANAQKVADKNKIKYTIEMDKSRLQNELKNFAKANSKLFSSKEMTLKYNQLVDAASIAKSKSELNSLRKQLSAFKTELVSVGKAGMTWSDKFKISIRHFAQYFSGASFIYAVVNQLRSAWTEAKTLDDRLVDFQKVTAEIKDRDSLYKYFDKVLKKASELNVKVDSLIYAITEFKKLGWSLSEAELGGEWATKLSNVGDIDIDTAIGSIKTSIASFDEIGGYGNDQMDKKLEAYADLINNMSNKYSIDAQGLAEAIRLSAGTLTEANTTIEQAATMFATANKYYNDPEYLGNTAKIGSLRMRATTGDDGAFKALSEMGEDVEEVTALTGKLREELIALTGVDIMVDNNTFKSYYDQLYEISQVIDELDDTTSAKVLEMMFGKNRAAAGMSLLSGMQESGKAYADAINSAGSATAEYETWMRGADAATQRFSNSLTEMYQSIINGNTVRDLASVGSAVLDFANKWGVVEGAVKGYLALKVGTLITNGTMAFITATKQVEQYGKALRMVNNIPNGNLVQKYSALRNIATATSLLNNAQLKQVLSSKNLSYQDRIRILQMKNMSKEMAIQKLNEMQLTQATNAQTAANNTQTASTFSLKSAMAGLGTTMKSVWLSNPVGISLMALSVAFSAVTSAISNNTQKVEETRQKNLEAGESAKECAKNLEELYIEYTRLASVQNRTSAEEESFKTIIEDVTEALGEKADALDGLKEGTDEYTKSLKEATKAELEGQYAEAKVGAKAAEDELKSKTYSIWGGSQITIQQNDQMTGVEEHMAALETVKDILSEYEDEGRYGLEWEPINWDSDRNNMNAVVEYYNALIEARDKLVTSDDADFLMSSDIYKDINTTINELSESIDTYTEQQYNALKLNYEWQNGVPSTVKEFNKMEESILKTSRVGEKFQEILKGYLAEDVDTFSSFIDEIDNMKDSVGGLGETTNEITVFSTSEAIEKLKSLEDTMSSLDESYASLFDGEKVDLSSLDGIRESFAKLENVDMSVVNSALDEISNAESLEEAQSAMDNLANLYIEMSGILEKVDESNADLIATQLEGIGISNADALVTEQLLKQKQVLADTGKTLAEISSEEALQILESGNASDFTRQCLANLVLEELTFNNTKLDVGQRITALQELAVAYGQAGISASMANAMAYAGGIADKDAFYNYYYNQLKEAMNLEPVVKYSGGTKSSKAKSESSKDAKDTTETFDWIETKISNLNDDLDSLDKKTSDVYSSWTNRNKALADSINKTKQAIDLQSQAYNRYMQEANSVGLSDTYKNLVQKGAIKIEDISDENLQEKIKDYETYWNKAQECLKTQEDLKVSLNELNSQKFDNIKSEFESLTDVIGSQRDLIQGQVDLLEMKGMFANESYYESMIAMTQKELDTLIQERGQLQAILNSGVYDQNSEEWNNMYSTLLDVDAKIQDATSNLVEFNNAMRDLNWEIFEYLEDSISRITDETSYLIDLLSNEDLFNDSGNLTKYGDATIGLHAVAYDTYKKQAQDYYEEVQELQRQLVDGAGKDVLEQYYKMVDAHQDSILAAEDEKKAILDLIEEGYNSQLEAIQKIIDKKKEQMNAERDLFTYQKSIEEKTANISALEKQKLAYEGDNSEEAISRIQQIKVQLEEAKADLKETEYEKYLSDTETMLDELTSDYEDWMNARLDNSDALLEGIISEISGKGDEINYTLSEVASQYGTMYSDTLISIFNSDSPFTNLISGGFSNVTNAINNLIAKVSGIAGTNRNTTSSNVGGTPSISVTPSTSSTPSQTTPTPVNNNSNSTDGIFIHKKYYKLNLNPDRSLVDRLKYDSFDASFSARASYWAKIFGGTYTGSSSQNNKFLQWLKTNGYQMGTRSATKGLHLYDEEGLGSELILSKEGTLMQFKGGETVFNKDMVDNLWNLAQMNPVPFDIKTPEFKGVSRNASQDINMNVDGISISLPNVTNYKEFRSELIKDSTFTNAIGTYVNNTMMGKNPLSHLQYSRK